MALAFSKIAVTLTLVAGTGVMIGFAGTVRLRLNDWKDITTNKQRVSDGLLCYLLYPNHRLNI